MGGDTDRIWVKSVEEVGFPDASLGVAEPGKTYAQVITPGYTIRLPAENGQFYQYHASDDRLVYVPKEFPVSGGGYNIRIERVPVTADQVSVATDLDGNPRIMGSRVDMGAYERKKHVYLPLLVRDG